MADPRKVGVYCESYLTSSAAIDLARGAFGTVVLPYHDAGDAMLRQNIQRLKAERMVQNVLFSVRWQPDRGALDDAIRYYAVDGIDLNPEQLRPEVIEVTDYVAAMDKMVIASPSAEPDFWIDALTAAGPRMKWWNLQLTDHADYTAWVCAIVRSGQMPSELAQSFVVPGYNLRWSTPETLSYELQGLSEQAPWLEGVFVHSYEHLRARSAEWSRAIWSGLGVRMLGCKDVGMSHPPPWRVGHPNILTS